MGVIARGRVDGAAFGAEWLFTDRRDGVSAGEYAALNVGASVGDDPDAVAANRAIIAGYLGADALALVRQVHGRDVARLTAPAPMPPDADAVITDVVDLPIAVQTADCVPILLADLVGGRVAAVHAGWRGVVADVIGSALDELAPAGALHAWIGPAICPGCYEVSEEVRAEVTAAAPEAYAQTRSGTPAVDVRAGVAGQLRRRGISAEIVGGCTFESDDLYSFRRDPITGRQAGVVVLREIR
ncbi:MAG: peptidoglycan editing factor PgeF [Candidatus Nanopelagicales bacterium]